jgi:hypothetical protein
MEIQLDWRCSEKVYALPKVMSPNRYSSSLSTHTYYSPPDYYTGSQTKVPTSYREAFLLTIHSSGPITSFIIIVLSIGYRFYLGNWSYLDALAVFILIVCWTFVEWGLHYYLLHAKPLPLIGIRIRSVFSRMHGEHHKDPWNPNLIHFKGPTVLGGWLLMTGLLWILFPLGPSITFSTCFFMMVERHQWVHLLVHSKVPVKSKYLQKIIQTHIKHHTIDSSKWMGVSAYLADDILGTNKSDKAS